MQSEPGPAARDDRAASDSLVVRISTHPAFAWLVRHVLSPLDPWIFRATNGRWTTFGPPPVPMVTLTTIGRRTGQPRPVHLACVMHRGDPLVVASAMGQERHPGWSHNLEAHPEVEVQARGERFVARAERLSDAEKTALWDEILRAIPQLAVYQQRTDRAIRVYRLRRLDGATQEGADS